MIALLAGISVAAVTTVILIGPDSGPERSGETVHLNIPANASDRLDKGRDVPQIPDRITGTVGDTLVIRNRDRATQVVAGYPVSPGRTLKIPLNRAGSYETSCSAHPEDSIRMVISE